MHRLEPSWLLSNTKVIVVESVHAAAPVGCYGGDGVACCCRCGAWIWWWP